MSFVIRYAAENFVILFLLAGFVFILVNRNEIGTNKNLNVSYFWLCVISVIVLMFENPLELWTAGDQKLLRWRQLLSVIGYVFRSAAPLFLVLTCVMRKKTRILLWIPEIANILIMSTVFYSKIAFWYDEQYQFHRGPLGFYVFVVSAFYVIVLIVTTLRKFMDGKRIEGGLLVIGAFATTIATIFDVKYGGTRVTHAILISTIYYYFYVSKMTTRQKENRHHGELQAAIEQAERDGLTGLYNRKTGINLSRAYVEHEIKEDECGAFLMIDVDNFKEINDSFGHREGDYWLNECSKILLSSVRNYDIVARYGGDEFFVLLKSVSEDVAISRAELMRAKVQKLAKEMNRSISISVGMCMIDVNNEGLESIIVRADDALYQAKHAGKNTFHMASRMEERI